ncbi:hypothetical protein TrVE_jg6624 [Triparma verrucosa]|uniref:Uncharacterized protein n=2 Tax=Triparma TaxID=722752 RepID=A0A9W7A2V9_9STRA|nr:hypothetical protein TrST_g1241 [Triparma strigata]GMH94363.1 hypothetical protein TrVE_jg6624 [Triparma verrucosa]
MAEMMGVSTNTKEWLKKAEHHLQNAERQIMSHVIPNAPNIKFEDATLAYQRAAEAYRVCEKWQEACDAYAKAADIQVKLGCPEEAASYASEAAETMVKVNPADAITFYRNAISLLCEVGKFGTAGRIQRKLAVWYEEDRNFDQAIDQYRQASDYYLGDNMVDQSDLCLLKCAYYQGLMEEFEDAAEIYATVGLRCLDNNLAKFNAREHFLRCGLLYLASGPHMHSRLKRNLMDFKTGDASFAFSRECLFLENLMAMHGSSDIHQFADHVYNFDNVSHLDSWCLEMLYEMRVQIQDAFDEKERKYKEAQERMKKEHEEEERAKIEAKRKARAAAKEAAKKR